jgi:peptidoglycan/LPS O-acetylase OafA/YrhL
MTTVDLRGRGGTLPKARGAPALASRRSEGTRKDIQGLRALAVALVVIFHLWAHGLRGGFVGVDVFFVISGFLITSHLLTKPPQTWSDLGAFWARRIRRLLPAALTVLTVSLVAVRLLAPDTQWKSTGQQVMAATLYWQNWRLAGQSVDYLHESTPPTVAQHFWSLSVEEQFYAIWPLLLAAAVIAARLLHRRLAPVAALVVSVPLVASLTWSVLYTRSQPAKAYFVTTTRIWELAVGALLAALVQWAARRPARRRMSRLGAVLRPVVVWAGFGAIAYSAATFDGGGFPGAKALVPVLGVAAVIAVHDQVSFTPNRLLALRPAQYLGDISYSVYLWHWPLIVLVPYALHHDLQTPDKISIMVAAVVASALTKRHIEDRFRVPRAGRVRSLVRPYRWAAVGMAGVVALSVMQLRQVDNREHQQMQAAQIAAATTAEDPCFGANALRADRTCAPAAADSPKIVPSPIIAPKDLSFSYNFDCQLKLPFTGFKSCVFGDPKATRNVALVGNSHAIHWLPALQQVALAEHFKITTFFSEQCFATTVRIKFPTPAETENCLRWGQQVLKATTTGAFDLVLTSERTYMSPVGGGNSDKVFQQGYSDYVKSWVNAGRRVLVLRDVPHPATTVANVPNCVAQHRQQLTACQGSRSSWVLNDPLADAVLAMKSTKAQVANLTDWFCTQTTCPPVIGGALVYVDGSHITATYARTLAPVLSPIVANALGGKQVDIVSVVTGKGPA